MWIRWRFGWNVRRLTPVVFLPTPPRYLALPRSVFWLPNEVFLPLTGHSRPIVIRPYFQRYPRIPSSDARGEGGPGGMHRPPRRPYFLVFSFSRLAVGRCVLL